MAQPKACQKPVEMDGITEQFPASHGGERHTMHTNYQTTLEQQPSGGPEAIESSILKGTVPVAYLKEVMGRMKESRAHMKLLEQQLEHQVEAYCQLEKRLVGAHADLRRVEEQLQDANSEAERCQQQLDFQVQACGVLEDRLNSETANAERERQQYEQAVLLLESQLMQRDAELTRLQAMQQLLGEDGNVRVQHLEHIMDRLKEKGAQMAQVEEWLQQQVEVQRGLEQRLKGALAETAKWRDRYEVDIKGLKQQLVDCETELRRWKSGRQEGIPLEQSQTPGSEAATPVVDGHVDAQGDATELRAHIESLEQQLEQWVDDVHWWQTHCLELQEQHAQELRTLQAEHQTALVQMQGELQETPSAQDPAAMLRSAELAWLRLTQQQESGLQGFVESMRQQDKECHDLMYEELLERMELVHHHSLLTAGLVGSRIATLENQLHDTQHQHRLELQTLVHSVQDARVQDIEYQELLARLHVVDEEEIGISSLQYSAGILWALYRKDRAACAQEEATAQAQVHAEAAGLQLQSVVQELAVVTLQRDASLRERDALRVAAEAQQQQSAADASVQQRMAHELQQLTAAHAQQMAARAQAHAAELQQLRKRCARTAVAEDALLGYVAVIAASVQQGQAVLHRRLEEAHGHAAALEAQLEHQQQQGAVKDATIQALAQSKEQKKRTLKQQELAITTLKEQKKVEVAQWQMAVQRLTQENTSVRQTLSDCTASLSHFHGCTTQQQQVMNAENAQRMAIAAETHAHCVAMFTEAFSRSHCSALASAELCARRGLAEAENRAFAELVLSTGLTKSAELGMRRALNTVRTALQKQQTCTTAMQEALDAQQGLRQLCEAEALSRMNIISAEGTAFIDRVLSLQHLQSPVPCSKALDVDTEVLLGYQSDGLSECTSAGSQCDGAASESGSTRAPKAHFGFEGIPVVVGSHREASLTPESSVETPQEA
eukprot:CAMPEP_0174311590 /NCGR_PEP_ID=MMETSP0810-20121108/3791_1 /TAXON_ID=73025 ORGANISM="Eutreptiella gymnastica-like, Strain CCMP1594" /NCGR_SAMPLE_ID=MMETSP0810 /ASSEMBLY_ACC=CAM_ASM_000659 /LENGTH=950 /DNA_ID=CAMNT_0015419833 /DNA_START=163 /DNA_END=3015 /DNA_ORIENTATION=+